MRSIRLVQLGEPLSLSTSDLPTPKAGSVLVKVERVGICHTDLHLIDEYYNLGDGRKLPPESTFL